MHQQMIERATQRASQMDDEEENVQKTRKSPKNKKQKNKVKMGDSPAYKKGKRALANNMKQNQTVIFP